METTDRSQLDKLARDAMLDLLTDPMTDFAARIAVAKKFRAAVATMPPIDRVGLRDDILDLIQVATSDLKVGVRPVHDLEGLVMAREAFDR